MWGGEIRIGTPPAVVRGAVDGRGLCLLPGFVDLHVHMREPGSEDAETIATACRAALAGGVTRLCCMPNTTPPLDDPEIVLQVREAARKAGGPAVHPVGAITIGREGKSLAPMDLLDAAGCVAFSDDGDFVQNDRLMRQAMSKARSLGRPIMAHCENTHGISRGCVHEGETARRLGIPEMPSLDEVDAVRRDVVEALRTNAHLHIQHVSTAGALEIIREGKRRGGRITAEVTPHHLALTEEDIRKDDAVFKMNPPIRTREDRDALRQALKEGLLDCIATDHAPHAAARKVGGLRGGAFGVIGLETLFPVSFTTMVNSGILTLPELIDRMVIRPCRLLGMQERRIDANFPADVVLADLDDEFTIEPERFESRSRNCPFSGLRMRGRVLATWVEGRLEWCHPEFTERITLS
ncbi:MAG: dihydroorotase [Planctomycetota bacterium]